MRRVRCFVTAPPMLYPGDRLSLDRDGAVFQLTNGKVLLIALYGEFDALDGGVGAARVAAVARVMAKLPAGYGVAEPQGDWVDLLAAGFYGHARKFLASPLPPPDGGA